MNAAGGTIPKIAIRGVRKSFGRNRVLDGIDLDCGAGESLIIIGGSGTGKSVLVKCILGLLRPDEGSIRIDDAETVGLGRRARKALLQKCGVLFQGSALFDSLKVWENVAITKLSAVGLGRDVAELRPAELSGGMQKRVALARAIAADPEIIFFDEPTTGLDPIMADVINNLILECVRGLGATAVSITHDMVSAQKVGDHIAMLHKGQIVWHGPATEIDRSGNPFVDQFIHGRAEGPIHMEVRAQ